MERGPEDEEQELQTSKEEMESLNEELQTVNAELQGKVEQLSRANDDMKNLLNAFKEAEIQGEGETWYLMRILPYRTTQNVIDGLVSCESGRLRHPTAPFRET